MLRNRLKVFCAAVLCACALLSGGVGRADDVEEFYRGKTLTFLVGGEAGGAYDVYARLLSRHIGRYIPGNPRLIMQYMPGAGSVIATNHLFNVAAQDGTVILAPNRTAPFAPYLGQKGARFDPVQIHWLGSLNNEVGVMQVIGSHPVKTIADARRTEVIVGSTSPLTDSEEYPTLLNNTLGTKFKLVRGYSSIEAIQIALERGEINGQENSFSGMAQRFPDWRTKMSILTQLSLAKHAAMPDVPLVFDFIKPEYVTKGMTVSDVENYWRIILTQQIVGRPYGLGPKVPAERVEALRAAFRSAVRDPKFMSEAEALRLELYPLDGQNIQDRIAKVAAQPASVIERLQQMIVYKGD